MDSIEMLYQKLGINPDVYPEYRDPESFGRSLRVPDGIKKSSIYGSGGTILYAREGRPSAELESDSVRDPR